MVDKNYRMVICISGGLDSYTAVHFAHDYFCLSIGADFKEDVLLLSMSDKDCPYNDKEQEIIKELYVDNAMMPKVHTVELSGYSQLVATKSHVILGRNAMIASIAAGVAPLVWINGTSFEDNMGMYDKNKPFFDIISKALEQACGYERQGTSHTCVMSPFQGYKYVSVNNVPANGHSVLYMDKHDMILYLEEKGYRKWRQTTSCFHPKSKRCGSCVVCGKRFVYESYAQSKSISSFYSKEIKDTFDSNPLENKSIQDTLESMAKAMDERNFSRYHFNRIKIYFEVMKNYGNEFAKDYYEKQKKYFQR